MSVEHIAIVLHHSKAVGAGKLVLIGIANHEGDGGAWPTLEKLSKYAGVGVRTVRKLIRQSEEDGELSVAIQQGGTRDANDRTRPNLYRILVRCPDDCDRTANHRVSTPRSPTPSPGGPVGPPPPVPQDPHPRSHRTPKPSMNLQENQTPSPPASPDGPEAQLFTLDQDQPTASPVQALVGAYADAVKAAGGIPTRAMCSAIGSNLKRLIRDDHLELPVLLLAVQRAGSRRAKTVDAYLGDVQQVFDRNGAQRQQMRDRWFAMAAEIDNPTPQIGAA